MKPAELPPQMLEVLKVVMPLCGPSSPATWPNGRNLKVCADGTDALDRHSDDEPLFQGIHQDRFIISFSLGQDLCTMEGMTQKHLQHRVPPQGNVNEPRINLTWRWVVKHNASCPSSRTRW